MTIYANFSSQSFLTTSGVAVAPLATVQVLREDTGAFATIYSDEAGTTPIAQPGFVADATGWFEFYAAGLPRGYRITVTKAGGGESKTLNHQAIGTAAQRDDGDFVLSSGSIMATYVQLTGDVTPAQIAADQNDYAPSGHANASSLRLSTDAERSITGLQGGSDGRLIVLRNVGSFNLVLKDENASSSAANRFSLGGSLRLLPGQSALLQYDLTTARWALWAHSALRQHGLCQLAKSGSNLVLSPKNGNTLIINGKVENIPDAGASLAGPTNTATMTIASPAVVTFNNHGLVAGQPIVFNTSGALPTGVTAGTTYYVIATGLTTNSFQFSATQGGAAVNTSGTQSGTHTLTGPVHYIYAFMSSGVMTLEAQLVAAAPHSAQAGTGVEIKTGDATRTLVGMARAVNNAWTDSATQRFVRSWFNDSGVSGFNTFSADRTTASTTFVELNAEIRVEFLIWAGDAIRGGANGACSNSGSGRISTGLAFDGAALEPNFEQEGYISTATADIPLGFWGYKTGASEGYHFATVVGRVNAGTGTWWTASSTASAKVYLQVGAGKSA